MNSTTTSRFEPKLRPDLEWSHQSDPSRWVARDPITENFFSLNQVEYTAASLMNGEQDLAEIVRHVRRLFPSAPVDETWLKSLTTRLQLHHLISPNSVADSKRRVRTRQELRKKRLLQQLMSPLAIRVPLIDPSTLLQHLRLPARILFHPLKVSFWVGIGACLLFLVLRASVGTDFVHSFDLRSIQGDRLLILFLCYIVAKSLHELGHLMACVHRDTECNEVGLMFLCLAPCLYCDTTDSWRLPSKWHRAGIAAAGMYVELILATLAAAVWLVTQEGTLHYVAASLMIVCSIGTLLVNANPLLKFDGYYILSDVWGVPNLAEQSREAVRALVRYALTARAPAKSQLDGNIWLLATYAVISTLYRTFLLALILWICWRALVPLGLGFAAIALTAAVLLGIVVGQIRLFDRFYRDVIATGSIHVFRSLLLLTLLVAIVAFVCVYPLPNYVRARAVTDYGDKQALFASQSAELVYAAPTSVLLSQGNSVLKFESPESDLELVALRGEIESLEQTLQQLLLRSAIDPDTAYQIPTKSEELSELRAREKLLAREIESLSHAAPYAGYLLKGPMTLPRTITAPRDDRRRPHPLDPSSIGCGLERGSLVGWFTTKHQLILTAIIPAQDVKLLEVGMHAMVQWDCDLAYIASGSIARIAPDPVLETPAELIGDPTLISIRNEEGLWCPETPHYEVSILINGQLDRLRGAPATVQLQMPSKTLVRRMIEIIRQNLKPVY